MATDTTTRTRLEDLVESFDRDAAAARGQIRNLMEKEPQSFLEGIVPVLRSCPGSPGFEYIVRLLAGGDYLFSALCDPSLTHAEAIALSRTALQVDPLTDVKLAQRLVVEASSHLSPSTVCRLMGVLDEVSSGDRIMPLLLRLMRLPEPKIRSKAVLMIGRASGSVKWVRSRLGDADARTRASAVEALWGNESAEVRHLLRAAARDSHNRVAGNALLALYNMGETSTIADLLKMAVSEAAMSRASAAWAMGETGDRRFADTLVRLICDANAVVRKRASAALVRLRSATAKTRTGNEWCVAARLLPSLNGVRHLVVAAGTTDGSAPPKLVATQFALTESERVVYRYQVEERAAAQALAVSFVFPRAETSEAPQWASGARNCLAWKRPSDLWRTVYFVQGENSVDAATALPPFSSDEKAAAAELEKQPGAAECRDFWRSLHDCVRATNTPARGARRLIVYCLADPGVPADATEIISAAMSAQAAVQVIATAYNAALEDLCRRTGGSFQIAAREGDCARLIEAAYQTLLGRYLITYRPLAPNADSLHIWVSNSTGWGETRIAL